MEYKYYKSLRKRLRDGKRLKSMERWHLLRYATISRDTKLLDRVSKQCKPIDFQTVLLTTQFYHDVLRRKGKR